MEILIDNIDNPDGDLKISLTVLDSETVQIGIVNSEPSECQYLLVSLSDFESALSFLKKNGPAN